MPVNFEEKIAVIIPCYKVTKHILGVIETIPENVARIYAVDDACPNRSGDFIQENCKDKRVIVLRNVHNQGVGGAVMHGYQVAINDGMEILVKIDGDGQMNPFLIDLFVEPILKGRADYTKGNRFFNLEVVRQMPFVRLVGNSALSFMSKFSTGYWNIFDPTNGYTAIHARVVNLIPFDKVSHRYFFETDLLFRLNTLRAVVVDIPMAAQYADEESNLKISNVIIEFFIKNLKNTFKRIFYNYLLRNFSVATLELFFGFVLLAFGSIFGAFSWYASMSQNLVTSTGTVMLAVLPILVGLQLILAFLSYDINSVPSEALHPNLKSD